MVDYYIGTCSWTDKTLIEEGNFYPPTAKDAASRLWFYAQNFNTVEVDSSFYSFPAERNSLLWAERTPTTFCFNFKSFSLFTYHRTPRKAIPVFLETELPENLKNKDSFTLPEVPLPYLKLALQAFLSALFPLQQEEKLGYILFQFPPWIRKSQKVLAYLAWLRVNLPPASTLAIEFRHRSWLEEKEIEDTFSFLRKHQLSYVSVDEPSLPWTVPPVVEATTSDLVVRFHGRNKSAWQKKKASVWEKFGYLYSEEELKAWKEVVKKKTGSLTRAFLMFNNCFRDYAVRNAQWMKENLD
ncbi:MAG: hypothetical protein PWP04_946 [Candidatus Atribacteria bacterium]|nr:hypothetical protein [Candidatus Atribacteria bacterium]